MSRHGEASNLRIITLDGRSGSGKSTLARALARELGWTFLDSGAWNRAVTWAVVQSGLDPDDVEEVLGKLSSISITSSPEGTVAVDGRSLGDELRSAQIDAAVGRVADHPEVRAALVTRMRAAAATQAGVVADGRDAGTVIFPDAGLQVFVDVAPDVRARRRHAQAAATDPGRSLADVRTALDERDARDAARGEAAPRITSRSVVLDNNNDTVKEAVGRLLLLAREQFPAEGHSR